MYSIVKISTPWNHKLIDLTPNRSGVFGNYKFEIDNDCDECDFYLVWGGVKKPESVKCVQEHVIYIADETHEQRKFNSDFLNQFSCVIACRLDLTHANIIPTHDLGIWHYPEAYDDIISKTSYSKTKRISAISSDLTVLSGHKKRYAFINRLIGHFKDRVDFYGRGINDLADKRDGLAPYKYSVAVENNVAPGYFTEKLYECYLNLTVPIYFGCPDIAKYFDLRSMVLIDIDDYKGAIDIIENTLTTDAYESYLPHLKVARKRYLEEYFVFPALAKILELNFPTTPGHEKYRKVKIKPESDFNRNIIHTLAKRVFR